MILISLLFDRYQFLTIIFEPQRHMIEMSSESSTTPHKTYRSPHKHPIIDFSSQNLRIKTSIRTISWLSPFQFRNQKNLNFSFGLYALLARINFIPRTNKWKRRFHHLSGASVREGYSASTGHRSHHKPGDGQ